MTASFFENIASSMASPCALITVVGAGGKTSLIDTLAKNFVLQGKRVIIAPSTKICAISTPSVLLEQEVTEFFSAVEQALAQRNTVTVGAYVDTRVGKVVGLSAQTISAMKKWCSTGVAHVILCEADGAARKPLKAPAQHEPVIPEGADICVGVMGVDSLHLPLQEENVHRSAIFAQITQAEMGKVVLFKHLYALAQHEQGLFKDCPASCTRTVLLNKADCLPAGESRSTLQTALQDLQPQHTWWLSNMRTQEILSLYIPCE